MACFTKTQQRNGTKKIVECAKAKATTVTICSVCPRNKTAAVSQRIESLNAGLKGIASDLSVDFLDNDPIFHLQDGSLNDGYLLADASSPYPPGN